MLAQGLVALVIVDGEGYFYRILSVIPCKNIGMIVWIDCQDKRLTFFKCDGVFRDPRQDVKNGGIVRLADDVE